MTPCPTLGDLKDFLNERLEVAARGDIGQHVDACPACQQTLDGLTVSTDLIGLSQGPPAGTGPHDPMVAELIDRLCRIPQPAPTRLPSAMLANELEHRAPLALDDFVLGECLGQGGMGAVYRAVQHSLNKPVAIKMLDRVQPGDEQLVARFFREARVAAGLRHPNIVDVHGIGRTATGGYFLVMDLVEGRDLERLVKTNSDLAIDPVPIVATVADAIQHAHDQQIIHRDLKPSNILIAVDGHILVTDFGIAKSMDLRGIGGTLSGQLLGTPAYMAPEQADPSRGPVGPATDVYGLGGILYFLLTRRSPYAADEGGSLAVIARVLGPEMPASPRQIDGQISLELEQICWRCLTKSPADRFQSAREVAAALRHASSSPPQQPGTSLPTAAVRASFEHRQPEPPAGAVPLDSHYYLVRDADRTLEQALARHDSIVLVRGARQMGKTSLLARGLQQARQAGTHIVLTDFQKLTSSDLKSAEALYLAIGDFLAERLDLDVSIHDSWNARRGASVNFERFLRRDVLGKLAGPLVWGLDEVDRLFPCPFSSEVFGLFRSWHNERALDPAGPWSRLTLAMAYATEAHLFITDINQSPFNVGTRISLADFTLDQIEELNDRYLHPLAGTAQVEQFIELVGGQPYLVNRSLYEMMQQRWNLSKLIEQSDRNDGIFGDHLRRIVVLLSHDVELRQALSEFMHAGSPLGTEPFYRLRSAGIVAGESAADCRMRCGLYDRYLRKQI